MVFPKESGCHVYSLKSPKTGLHRPSSLLFQMTTPIIHEALKVSLHGRKGQSSKERAGAED